MEWIASPEAWVALVTLTLLEIVLGIDNIIFISILVGRLPEAERPRARVLGLRFAMGTRILLLLLLITGSCGCDATLFTVLDVGHLRSGSDPDRRRACSCSPKQRSRFTRASKAQWSRSRMRSRARDFVGVIVQIGIIDIVFSLDSVITAVGMAEHRRGDDSSRSCSPSAS